MSLFGKILALFNILGAIGLFVLAVMDYGKRQQWAYSVLQHELVLIGLPLDDKETDEQGRPMVDRLAPATIAAVYAGTGNDNRPTQVDEVKRVKEFFEGKLSALQGDERAQTDLLARILLPLSESYLEREELLAARHYFGSPARFEELKGRYQRGFADAKKFIEDDPKIVKGTTFEEAMHVAMRAQGGEASDVLTTRFINQLPTELPLVKAARFDEVFAKTTSAQLQALRERMEEKFARALTGPILPGPHEQDVEDIRAGRKAAKTGMTQKRRIARTLFALAQPTAEETAGDALKGEDRGKAEYAEKVANTAAYKMAVLRVYQTCGLRVTLAAIADEAAEVRRQASAATDARLKDQMTFVRDHNSLVEELRDRYELMKAEDDRVKESVSKIAIHEELIKLRTRDRDAMASELAKERSGTRSAADKLAQTSDEVLRLRLQVRDAIRETEEAEKEIRRLGALIRAREEAENQSKK